MCVWGAGLGYVRASGEGRGPQRTAPVGGGPGLENGRTDSPPSADGKLYDAYVSYSDSPEDRKFVNFILKPQLERRRGYKLFLDDRDLLPRAGTTVLLPVPALPRAQTPPLEPPVSRRTPPLLAPRPCGPSLGPASVSGPAPALLVPPPVGPRPRQCPVPAEPSADLLVNLSRCRRLIVVLSDAFLGRAWCSHSFR